MAIKHSKYKNTGILFELLVRQIASDMLSGKKDSFARKLTEKYFNQSTELGKELILYRSFFNMNKPLSENAALDFISMVCEQRTSLSNKKLAEEKYELVKEIKNYYDLEDFFSHRVPSYKVYASAYKNFEATNQGINITNFEDLASSKMTLTEHLLGKIQQPRQKESEITKMFREQSGDLRILTYKLLIEKFNDKYASLSIKQKNLLKEYINNISDRKVLSEILKKESVEVANNISNVISKIPNKILRIKLEEVVHQLNEMSTVKSVQNHHLTALMMGYEIEKQLLENIQ